jgi:hypothetical protein
MKHGPYIPNRKDVDVESTESCVCIVNCQKKVKLVNALKFQKRKIVVFKSMSPTVTPSLVTYIISGNLVAMIQFDGSESMS